MRLIDADVLKEAITQNREIDRNAVCDVLDLIDNAPTVEPQKIVIIPPELIEKLASNVVDIVGNIDWEKAIEAYKARPCGACKTCKYYHPYFEQLTNIPRGDGYCVIARMTPEGMTTINCSDEFSCSDYQSKEGGV